MHCTTRPAQHTAHASYTLLLPLLTHKPSLVSLASGSDAGDSEGPEEEEEEEEEEELEKDTYIVERIAEHQKVGRGRKFLVHWLGYAEPSLELEKNLKALEVYKEYVKALPADAEVRRSPPRRSPPHRSPPRRHP